MRLRSDDRLQLDDTLLRRHAHIIRTHARSVVDHHTPRESANQLSSYVRHGRLRSLELVAKLGELTRN